MKFAKLTGCSATIIRICKIQGSEPNYNYGAAGNNSRNRPV